MERSGGVSEARDERTRRFREKGASLFNMIPLERWNVEREGHFSSKSNQVPAYLRPPIGSDETVVGIDEV